MDALSSAATKFLLDAVFGPVAGGLLGGLLVSVDLAGARGVPAGRPEEWSCE